ncbi:hypothetical protein SAMN04487857_1338 [Pseudomonas sp. ok272]|uniref:hypothetical protein n=1 Tax=unclassified Pseudomonas TaxID=196821 RepID=UPI0008D7F0FE|nr:MULTISPECIES: hypothetical protein [unclassified Pseudomonas]SEN66352.1 hypothetical protein SAMN04487857_1338 [Pseudomonas sp. ok272]SFN46349.1 hypothetical protein SAMN04487858_1352 [Pseudomonas sp. ok602]
MVVLPLVLGLLAYALRLLAYERQHDFVQGWSERRDEQEQALIARGRRAVVVVGSTYCTAAGSNQLANALRHGSQPLQAVYVGANSPTIRVSQLMPVAQQHTEQEYAQRLAASFEQMAGALDVELQPFNRDVPLCVRIKHNQVLSDDAILSLWRSSLRRERPVDQVVFATTDDGLMWLDSWLDEPPRARLLLSIEVNLFLEPVPEHAESVSAVLLATAELCTAQEVAPMARVHRPVRVMDPAPALQDACRWGELSVQDKAFFTWHSQMSRQTLGDAHLALFSTGYRPDVARTHSLDKSLGLPECAVGNIALILASEQARTDQQPQLVMLRDTSVQALVVQPVR